MDGRGSHLRDSVEEVRSGIGTSGGTGGLSSRWSDRPIQSWASPGPYLRRTEIEDD